MGPHYSSNNFEAFQEDHQFALIAFSSGVRTPFSMATEFVQPMVDQIELLTDPIGGTNIESALTQARNLSWSPGQMDLPVNERTRQVVVLFSDGQPKAFRGGFTRNGTFYDATVPDGSISIRDPNEYHQYIASNYKAYPSGNGTGSSGDGFDDQCGSGDDYKRVKMAYF